MFYGWTLLATLSFIYFIAIGTNFYGFSVIIPLMVEDLGWTRTEVGAGQSVIISTIGFCGPIVALVIKRVGCRWTMLAGGFICGSGSLLVYGTQTLLQFYMGLGIMGMGMSMLAVVTGIQLITQWFLHKRSLAMGIFMASAGLGAFVAAPAFAWLSEYAGSWRLIWLINAAAAIFSALLAVLIVKDSPKDVGSFPDGLDPQQASHSTTTASQKTSAVYKTSENWYVREAIRTRAFLIITLSTSVGVIGSTIVNSHSLLHMRDMGISLIVAAGALGITGLLGAVGRFSSGFFGDRIDPARIMAFGLLLIFSSFLLLPYTDSAIRAYTFAVLFGLGYGVTSVASPSLVVNYFGMSNFASIFAIRGTIITVGGALGPLLAGWSYQTNQSYDTVLFGYAALVLVTIVIVISMKPPQRSQAATQRSAS